MKTSKENRQLDDEFEPLEIGTVSEDTRGGQQPFSETGLGQNSMPNT